MDSNTGNADAVKADAYWKRLRRRLRRPDMLMAYVETAERVLEEYGEEKKEWYLKLAVPVFSRLCSVYEKKSMTMMTCFVYVLGRSPLYVVRTPFPPSSARETRKRLSRLSCT